MSVIIDKTLNFIKEEVILSVSVILAIISCFFVKPSVGYLDYINWDTIILLFVIMVVVEILKNLAIFEMLVHRLLNKVKNTRGLVPLYRAVPRAGAFCGGRAFDLLVDPRVLLRHHVFLGSSDVSGNEGTL